MAKVGQPGAAPLGNFINYYDFNPADRRINFLPKELLSTLLLTQRKEIIILDIGCNSGVNLTINWIDILNNDDRHSVIGHFLEEHNRSAFDLVTCFSVTLWIHINHGDEVFRNFLKILSDASDYLMLEPQPWKCYKSAVRRMTKLGCEEFQYFKTLQWNRNIVDNIIEHLTSECGMKMMNVFGTTTWDRKIFLLKNMNSEVKKMICLENRSK
ncbi:hypothetical protein LSH36_1156g00060 [Paralvinella palmiformis]|uniref:RNA methyltransferase n=1 Tax=Paralvinella palmiformis TaxID=53620 RepID=A0AAD9MRG7_9ANNE|nr:hypothetical protein LSH36_1156g00060 [Paralvinella palmiformis]